MSTVTVTVHLGIVPIRPEDWTSEPLDGIARPQAPHPFYAGTSFRAWGEAMSDDDFGEPHEVTVDLEAKSWIKDLDHIHNRHGGQLLSWAGLEEVTARARDLVCDLVPNGWRLVDYCVVTDDQDHSLGARTVGMWGA